MIISQEERKKFRIEKNNDIIDFDAKSNEIAAIAADILKKKYAELEKQLRDLQDQRFELMEMSLSKNEWAVEMKRVFMANRDVAIGRLSEHFKKCHSKNIAPFPERFNLFKDYESHYLLYLILSEKDLDESLNLIPEGVISAKERDKKLVEIDLKIAKLKNTIKSGLEKARKEAVNSGVTNPVVENNDDES
ncbi:MAG: hypothetical protein RBT11_18665 [Desulfobacterales bacterium]|jgi:hypothetical protein|nr:hypothetical protein [Desulfobacterales bacterium]